jgi:hypothetical protein
MYIYLYMQFISLYSFSTFIYQPTVQKDFSAFYSNFGGSPFFFSTVPEETSPASSFRNGI